MTWSNQLLDRIFQDLESVKNDIENEIKDSSDSVSSDLKLFRDGGAGRALALLKAANDADITMNSLKPAAMALEYLQLGALKHFGGGRPDHDYGTLEANLSLITADYYYARALGLIVALGDDRLVELLCDALAEVSEGYAWPDEPGAETRRAAFTRAAGDLASIMTAAKNDIYSTMETPIEEEV
jgi:hypothetical protein